ncbi:MAG TPA: PfkB family carbohydrate kinase [Ktedonobacteraceae bacterium]
MAQTTAWDLVVVGGAYTDYVVRGPRLPVQGETTLGNKFLETAGGKGANQAVAAARLGARVALVSRVGNDARGDEILTSLQHERVDTRYVRRDPEVSTGLSLIQLNEQAHKQMMVWLGACYGLTIEDVQHAEEACSNAKVVLTQLEAPLDVIMTAMRIGHKAHALVILDPAPAPPHAFPDDLFSLVDIIRPDSKEAETITGVNVRDRESAHRAAEQLLQRGVRASAIQAGEEGDLLLWPDGSCWLPRIPIKSIDTTGAGDAFVAALAVALSEGQTLMEAGPFASAAAALTTTKLGARPALPRREAALELLQKRKSVTAQER